MIAGNLVNSSVLAMDTRHLDEGAGSCLPCEMGSEACEIHGWGQGRNGEEGVIEKIVDF